MADLDRFLDAQDAPAGAGTVFERALAELRGGRKTTHWMWFVFPQAAGVAEWHGATPSPTARRFAIAGRGETAAYLDHPTLGPRLVAAFEAALASGEADPERLMGGIDAAKLKSCATLFAIIDAERGGQRAVFAEALASFYGDARCPATEALLSR